MWNFQVDWLTDCKWIEKEDWKISPKIESTQNQFICYFDIWSLSCHAFPIVWSAKVCKNAYSSIDQRKYTHTHMRNILFHSREKNDLFLCVWCVVNGIGIGFGTGTGILITFRQLLSKPFLLINTFLFSYSFSEWVSLLCAVQLKFSMKSDESGAFM